MIDIGSLLGLSSDQSAVSGYGGAQKTLWNANANTYQDFTTAINYLQDALKKATQYEQPYYDVGTGGLNALGAALTPAGGMTPVDMVSGLPPGQGANLMNFLTKTPAYQFPLQQGAQLIQQSAAAKGNALSPGTLQALTQYGQNYAMSNALAPSQNQYQNYLKNIAGLAGGGQQAAGTLGNWNQQTGTQEANAAMWLGSQQNALAGNIAGAQANQGMAQLSANANQAQTLGNAFGSIANLLTNLPWSQIGNSLGAGSSYGGVGAGGMGLTSDVAALAGLA